MMSFPIGSAISGGDGVKVGTIGTRTDENMLGSLDFDAPRHWFYMNTKAPANASGAVSTIQYCYSLGFNASREEAASTVGFYRPHGDGFNLTHSFNITVDPDVLGFRNCVTMNISSVEVETDDVIGVCLRSFRYINFISESNDDFNMFGLMTDLEDPGPFGIDALCTSVGVMPLTVASNQLERGCDLILHIFARVIGEFFVFDLILTITYLCYFPDLFTGHPQIASAPVAFQAVCNRHCP